MQKVRPRRALKIASAGFILALAAIPGCSTVDSGLKGVPGTGKPFPNLASVPEKPTHYSTPAERKAQEDKLHLLAQALLEYETLTGDEIKALLETGKVDRPDEPRGPAIARPAQGSAIPKAGKRFSGGTAPQGA